MPRPHRIEGEAAPGRFDEQVILIAGAAGGIGAEVTRRFAEEGAAVAAFDVGGLERIRPLAGDDALVGEFDVTNPDSCAAAVDATLERFGRIDAMAIVAGVVHAATPVRDLSPAEWDRVMDVNLRGPFLLARATVPHLRAGGSVVTIGSWWGQAGHAFFSAYCSSKAGLVVFTQCLAEELAESGSRANCICPGNINTSMHREALQVEADQRGLSFDEMKEIEWAKIPLGKAGDPVDIANAVLFLSSDEAKYITGASLDVNGGVLFRS